MELGDLTKGDKEILAKKFVEEVILPQWTQLSSWNKLTNQTSQLDFGYLSQHLVSIVSGISGNDNRGKGDDLADGSEVKAASCVDAVDTPRWNNVNCGARLVTEIEAKFTAMPYLFFVLLDTTIKGGGILRCRIWCVRPSEDMEFMKIMKGWARENNERNDEGKSLKTNLQLHPPRWEKGDSNITTNTVGNLNLPLLYESVQLDIPGILVMQTNFFDETVMKSGLSKAVSRHTPKK